MKNGVTIKQLYKDIEYDVFGRHLDAFIFLNSSMNEDSLNETPEPQLQILKDILSPRNKIVGVLSKN